MASRRNGTLYLGVTSDLAGRAYQHRNALVEGFTKRHGCTMLVWFESYDDLQEARLRELQMKKWKRAWKIELIERENPQWRDLFETLF
ncbi:MAG: GIY-YIG nuclease family protein [Sphingobium sp.]|jgi:putative endonuclease|uniref:Endonuclease n=1 Tax=Sphingobium xenophagum TaxID=121428 RepID=A0A401J0N9_SPHXE|nr:MULTISPECIES: GIY-YIG nuclease family protein [Sphingobium]MBU0659135.1 GIY-YIG nuclease family protein [Alphaproteobacteria bacterium]MBA4755922.1 GIY-YIG nuclease family protein [Sphingobium sp.]MBS86968.1 endonuclease [Sphingobium sp.]MBU0774817.1 GIY-YIG nuclease family protein [Alphaproteobacteria bacterium]MBU1258140.1 GIY-YIG nuclease family protein [Alphaproteobacteria bacterium]